MYVALSATETWWEVQICGFTMPKDAGPLWGAGHVGSWTFSGANGWHDLLSTTSSKPWLGLIVWYWVQIPLRERIQGVWIICSGDRPDFKVVISRLTPQLLGAWTNLQSMLWAHCDEDKEISKTAKRGNPNTMPAQKIQKKKYKERKKKKKKKTKKSKIIF